MAATCDTHKELSGVLSSDDKWAAVCESLTSADCVIQHLRVYHNNLEQSIATANAIASNTSVTSLEFGDLQQHAASVLAQALKVCDMQQTP